MTRLCTFAFLVLLFGASPGRAFLTPRPADAAVVVNRLPAAATTTTTSLRLTEAEIPVAALTARGDCVFWFFGASGAAGIARSAFPGMFQNFVGLQKLKNVGPTLGGEMLGINPLLCGYPQDLSKADVEQVVNNPLSVEKIVQKYPIPGNFLTAKGWLALDAFQQPNANANPLAVRAVFDTFTNTPGLANPFDAQARLDKYKTNVQALKFDLLAYKLLGWVAIITLLFLLGIADIIAFSDVYKGWFPDWPGGQNFPFGMLNPNGSPFSIRDYWI